MAEYHSYVFDQEKRDFVGKFEEMYQAGVEKGFDSLLRKLPFIFKNT